jgi:flagellar FliL protein
MVDAVETEEPQKSKSGLIPTVAAVAVVTVIAAAGGWFIGGLLAPAVAPPKPEPAAVEGAETTVMPEEGLPRTTGAESGVVQLEPITTNLAYPADSWIRLEVALLFKDKPDTKLAETIHQDIMVYLRTVTLQQIEGPRGFQYLKEDLEDRAELISEGKIAKILFRTFVIE